MPLSNPTQADKAETTIRGAELSLQQINEVGGSRVGEFGLISCDTGYDPETGAASAAYLRDDLGIPAAVGAIASSVTDEILNKVVVDESFLLVSPASTAPSLSGKRRGFFWRTIASDSAQASAAVELLDARSVATEDVFILYFDGNIYSTSLFNEFSQRWIDSRMEPPVSLRITEGTEANDIISAIAASDAPTPSTIVVFGTANNLDLINAFEQAYTASLDTDAPRPTYLFSEALRDEQIFALPALSQALDRIEGTIPLRSQTSLFTSFESAYTGLYGPGADPLQFQFTEKAYDAAYLIALAMEAQEEPTEVTPRQISDVLKRVTGGPIQHDALANDFSAAASDLREGGTIELRGVSGEVNFDADGDILNPTIARWSIDASGSSPTFVNEEIAPPQ